jgi:O-acetyl-ADP-ribose deacetylase (regulator of RNase III)
MSVTVTLDDILSVPAEAAVLPLEMTGRPTEGRAAQRLAQAGGEGLRRAVHSLKFLPVGSAAALETEGLPFGHVIVTPVPRWLNGKCNELLALDRCYESVFALAERLGLGRIALPFLSTCYYRFPAAEAVHIALRRAEAWPGEAIFAADTEELLTISQSPYRKPGIVEYVGYYRDYAMFALENGRYARVDLRPEIAAADSIPYIEPCYRAGVDPLQAPLPEAEIRRLAKVWEDYGI